VDLFSPLTGPPTPSIAIPHSVLHLKMPLRLGATFVPTKQKRVSKQEPSVLPLPRDLLKSLQRSSTRRYSNSRDAITTRKLGTDVLPRRFKADGITDNCWRSRSAKICCPISAHTCGELSGLIKADTKDALREQFKASVLLAEWDCRGSRFRSIILNFN
jgi:hypothetical protein